MLNLNVNYQESYSRIELLTRSFLGIFYIIIPHAIVLFFVVFWAKLLWLYSTFYILINGVYPKKAWDFQIGLIHWLSRLHMSVYNLADGYPPFGVSKRIESLEINVTYNESPDRLWVLIRFMFTAILLFPHIFVWTFRNLVSGFLSFYAFWVVLFTGKYPKSLFDFNVGTLRWVMRIMGYQLYLFDDYPPFSGNQ